MQKVKGIKLACLAAFAILPVQAYALGVGKLTMQSALDEPLKATIALTAATSTELQTLEVALGAAGVFSMAGIDRSEQLKAITFTLVKENGKDVIKLSTENPFRDPFLHFIVKASWANGSMLREYTALLDPPSYLTEAPASIQAPTVVAAKPVMEPKVMPVVKQEKMMAKPAATAAAPISPADAPESKLGPDVSGSGGAGSYSDVRPGSTYGPIRSGDALWNIAEDVKSGTDLGVAQVMMAIFKQNPNAFLHNNINMIRAGKTLEIPSDTEISSTSRSVAQEELRAQMEEWQEYKDGLSSGRSVASATTADKSTESEAMPADEKSAADSKDAEKASSETVAKKRPLMPTDATDAGSDDVLEIVRAKMEGSDASGAGVSAADQKKFDSVVDTYKETVTQLEESLSSAELEKNELETRVSLLEEQIDKANKLIDMQNSDLANLQQKSKAPSVGQIDAQDKMAPTDKANVAPIPPTATETKSAHLSAPDITPVEVVSIEAKKPVVKAPEAKKPEVAKKKRVVKRPQPVEEKGLLESIQEVVFDSWVTMLGAGLALLLVLVGLFVVFRRRRSIAEFEDSIISGTAVLDISTAESSEPSDSGSETSFLSDFVPGMGNMQADEVDPLAEAEVYMAYGRDEQAEEVLKDAAGKNPDRHELKLKLLEIYQSRKDISSFETLAEELYPADGNIPIDVWNKVAEMGKAVNPDNPLFQGELKLQEETLFGDKGRKEDVQLGDLLDTDTMDTEEAELMDALNMDSDLDEDTEEVINLDAVSDADDAEEISDKKSDEKADDFPVPDEAVLDLDLGDFTPDAAHETDSFDLDSLELNMAELEGNDDGLDAISEESVDFNLDGIDLDLGDTAELDSDTEDSSDALDIGSIEGLDLDLDSEEESETSEVAVQDETLEFADLGDLTLDEAGDDLDVASDTSVADESGEMAAGANETWDEAGTKLDLAKAYIEMDDKDSAQSILEEVAKEGTDDQKNEARDLMSQLSAG